MITKCPINKILPISTDYEVSYRYFNKLNNDELESRLKEYNIVTSYIDNIKERKLYYSDYFAINDILEERKSK